jgi:hypothetical protein
VKPGVFRRACTELLPIRVQLLLAHGLPNGGVWAMPGVPNSTYAGWGCDSNHIKDRFLIPRFADSHPSPWSPMAALKPACRIRRLMDANVLRCGSRRLQLSRYNRSDNLIYPSFWAGCTQPLLGLRSLIRRGEQFLGARSPWQLNFVRWSLTSVGPRNLLQVTFLAPKILEDLCTLLTRYTRQTRGAHVMVNT